MKTRILILALTAIAASSQAVYINITQTLPEIRSWNSTEFSPWAAEIPVYGTLSLDERDGIVQPFLPGDYVTDEYYTASFIAPATEPNGGRDGFERCRRRVAEPQAAAEPALRHPPWRHR
jgi:hypothetical protein